VAIQNTVFKASDAEICVPVTKLITNDRMRIEPVELGEMLAALGAERPQFRR
jgi:hypothetical protein